VVGTQNLKEASGNRVIFFSDKFCRFFLGINSTTFAILLEKFSKISDITKLKKKIPGSNNNGQISDERSLFESIWMK